MCPDRKILSLYHDGELPPPWKEKMEAHLASCQECRASLARYGDLRESLRRLPADGADAAQERVWKKLSAPVLAVPGKKPAGAVWKRSITLPLPAAAAAAVIITAAFFAVLAGVKGGSAALPQDTMTAAIGLDEKGMVQAPDMHGVLQYLSSQDNGDFMVISLPENSRFARTGEPTLINAADYSRRTNSR